LAGFQPSSILYDISIGEAGAEGIDMPDDKPYQLSEEYKFTSPDEYRAHRYSLQDVDFHDRIPWVKRTNQPINYNDLIALTVLVSVDL